MAAPRTTLRPPWYQPDLFTDDWITLEIKLHMQKGEWARQVGYTVVNAWNDEVLATGLLAAPHDDAYASIQHIVHLMIDDFDHSYRVVPD